MEYWFSVIIYLTIGFIAGRLYEPVKKTIMLIQKQTNRGDRI